jgi:hypothetical protein
MGLKKPSGSYLVLMKWLVMVGVITITPILFPNNLGNKHGEIGCGLLLFYQLYIPEQSYL